MTFRRFFREPPRHQDQKYRPARHRLRFPGPFRVGTGWRNSFGNRMEANCSDKLLRIAKAALFGFLGGTAIIHITPLASRSIRDFENRYLEEAHREYETAVLLIVGLLTMVMEPVFYLVNLALSLDTYGPIGLFWLAPVGVSQSSACIWWIATRRTSL
jgi:hypothetical protein